LKEGADPNIANNRTGWSALTWAARHGLDDNVKILLQYNAFLHCPDKNGFFPIDYAGMFGHYKCVERIAAHLIQNVKHFVKQTGKNKQMLEADPYKRAL
jgi:ankyrin repeat protein